MANGLFQSQRQVADMLRANDVALGQTLGNQDAAPFTGAIFSGLAEAGRALTGNVDPRVALASAFEGKDLNSPEDLQSLALRANELGLPEQAFALADRIRSVTPKAAKPVKLNKNERLIGADGTQLVGIVEDEDPNFQVFDIQRDNGQIQRVKKNIETGEEFLVSQTSATAGSGGSGSGGAGQRQRGFESGQIGARLEETEGFKDLGEDERNLLGTAIAPAISDLVNVSGTTESEAFDLVTNELSKGGLEEGFFDIGDPNNVSSQNVQRIVVQVLETERQIKDLTDTLAEQGVTAPRSKIIERLQARGELDAGYGKRK